MELTTLTENLSTLRVEMSSTAQRHSELDRNIKSLQAEKLGQSCCIILHPSVSVSVVAIILHPSVSVSVVDASLHHSSSLRLCIYVIALTSGVLSGFLRV